MELIKVFDTRADKSKTEIKRTATRAVIQNGNKILLIYVKNNSEYKFPGGGVEDNETFIEALKREVLEEAGATISEVKECIGYTDQFYPDKYIADEVFSMRSIYYLCDITNSFKAQDLSTYELELGFIPSWVSIDEAIKTNEERLKLGNNYHWTERELFMLNHLKNLNK
ncbi:MAG: NUDIX domain-containing protein [Tenericutes bacterium]|nr:NUDIX domain-containing protein [Mycoplasmatota bacterium]